jgi:C_GCAxxG_C_C family probable redox protein
MMKKPGDIFDHGPAKSEEITNPGMGIAKIPKERLLSDAESRVFQYALEYKNCCQCTLLALQELFDLNSDDTLKSATGFVGGIGRTGSVCGALVAGIMAFGLLYGRDLQTMKHPDPDFRNQRKEEIESRLCLLARELCERFQKEFDSIICDEIERKLLGRSFDKWDPKDREEKARLGGYERHCPSVMAKGARWAAEIILKERASP